MVDKRNKILCFAVRPDELRVIEDNANKLGMSKSAYVRSRTVNPELSSREMAEFLAQRVRDIILKQSPITLEQLRPPKAAGGVPEPESLERKHIPTRKLSIQDVYVSPERAKELAEFQKAVVKEMEQCLAERKKLVECGIEILKEEK